MANELSGRRMTYAQRYARTAAAAYQVADIRKAIESEQDRVQYLDSLIATERQTLATLTEVFRAAPVNFADAQRLLQEQVGVQESISLAEQAGQSAAARAAELPADERRTLAALTSSGQKAQATRFALGLIAKYPGAAGKVLTDVTRSAARFDSRDLDEIRAAAGRARAPATGVPRAARERVEELQGAFAESLESAYFAGPSGIRGGYEGLEVSKLRELTADQLRERAGLSGDDAQRKRLEARADALDGSNYATGQDALNAALAVVRSTGSPQQVEDPFARSVYEEARQRQAYRNDQRADFEQEVLDGRARLSQLEQEKTRLSGAYDDPQQEIIRRQLRARGFEVQDPYTYADGSWTRNPQAWRNDYMRFQNTPLHEYYTQAHERVDKATTTAVPLAPSSRAENIAVQYTMMRARGGQATEPQELADQLKKAGITGRALSDAVSFTMAYWELGGPEQDPETLKMRKRDEAREREEEDTRRTAATALARDADEARETVSRQEARAVGTVEELRSARGTERGGTERAQAAYIKEYQRQLGMGRTREEAVAAARSLALGTTTTEGTQTRTATGIAEGIQTGAEALLARQAGIPAVPPGSAQVMMAEPDPVVERLPYEPDAVVERLPYEPDATQDPNNAAYSYRKTPAGYEVLNNGRPTGVAQRGTAAFQSIEAVLAGGQPLPAPLPVVEAVPAPVVEPVPAPVVEPRKAVADMTEEELRALLDTGR